MSDIWRKLTHFKTYNGLTRSTHEFKNIQQFNAWSNLLMQSEICSTIYQKNSERLHLRQFLLLFIWQTLCLLKCTTELSHTPHVTVGLASTQSSRDSMQTSYIEQSCTRIDWWLKWLFQQAVEYHTAFPLLWHFSWNGSCQCWGMQLDTPSFCHAYTAKYALSNVCSVLF